jgi:hypothetical protein
MARKITDSVIDALQYCRLKAYFKLHGEEGVQCGYEKLLIEQRANVQRKAIEKIQREYSHNEIGRRRAAVDGYSSQGRFVYPQH